MSTDRSSDAWRRRVEALLAKAASTPFGPEADALIAKAHQLMVRHSIDEAVFRDGRSTEPQAIGRHPLVVHPPYASAKSSLLSAIARANGCQVVLTGGGRGPQPCVLVGSSTDRHNTLAMYGWLVLYAIEAMAEAEVPPSEGARRFRHAFLLSFAARIGERLQRTTAATEEAVGSTALVLRTRRDAVDAFMAAEFPFLRRTTRAATSRSGAISGHRAADRAGLGRSVPGAAGAALPPAP